MATRFCGKVRITMQWVNPAAPSIGSHYRVRVSSPMTRERRDYIILEWVIGGGHAVDSSHAFNAVAAEVVRSLAVDDDFGPHLGYNMHAMVSPKRGDETPLPLVLRTTTHATYEVLP